VVLGATLDAPSVLAFFGTSVVVQRWGRGRKKTPGNSTENSPENEQLEPKNQPEINQSKGMSNLPNLDFWGFHVSFRDPLEVQSTKTKCLVFRMIHGARIPDPTKGQSLVKDFLNVCFFGKMDGFDFDSGCQEAKRSDPS